MIVSHRHRFIFIKTRKTAGTSLQHALSTVCAPTDVVTVTGYTTPDYAPRNYQGLFNPAPYLLGRYTMHRKSHVMRRLKLRQRIHDHMFLIELFNLPEAKAWTGYFRFCVERNPWDKVVSRYFWKYRDRDDRPDFETFVASDRLVSDVDMYSLSGEVAADLVLKYEELPQSLETVERRFGIAIPPMMGANSWTRSSRDYCAMYTDASRTRVARHFAREIDMLGYRFDDAAARCGWRAAADCGVAGASPVSPEASP